MTYIKTYIKTCIKKLIRKNYFLSITISLICLISFDAYTKVFTDENLNRFIGTPNVENFDCLSVPTQAQILAEFIINPDAEIRDESGNIDNNLRQTLLDKYLFPYNMQQKVYQIIFFQYVAEHKEIEAKEYFDKLYDLDMNSAGADFCDAVQTAYKQSLKATSNSNSRSEPDNSVNITLDPKYNFLYRILYRFPSIQQTTCSFELNGHNFQGSLNELVQSQKPKKQTILESISSTTFSNKNCPNSIILRQINDGFLALKNTISPNAVHIMYYSDLNCRIQSRIEKNQDKFTLITNYKTPGAQQFKFEFSNPQELQILNLKIYF